MLSRHHETRAISVFIIILYNVYTAMNFMYIKFYNVRIDSAVIRAVEIRLAVDVLIISYSLFKYPQYTIDR